MIISPPYITEYIPVWYFVPSNKCMLNVLSLALIGKKVYFCIYLLTYFQSELVQKSVCAPRGKQTEGSIQNFRILYTVYIKFRTVQIESSAFRTEKKNAEIKSHAGSCRTDTQLAKQWATFTGFRLVLMMTLCSGPASLGGSLGSFSKPWGLV